MTKREYFAAQAMQGLLASDTWTQNSLGPSPAATEITVAGYAVKAADELIAALNR
jgi:hypothetical protein